VGELRPQIKKVLSENLESKILPKQKAEKEKTK
jgi:hypothetical protein